MSLPDAFWLCDRLLMFKVYLPNTQIAEKLQISIKTVETHRGNMMRKLDVHDRAGLVKFAMDSGLVTLQT